MTPEQTAAKKDYERASRKYAQACQTGNKAKIAAAYDELTRAQSAWFIAREQS